MKAFKKTLRVIGLVVMVMLAVVGVGLTGAAPIMPKNRERLTNDDAKIELVEQREDEGGIVELKEIK